MPVADVPVGAARSVSVGPDHLLVCRPTNETVHVLEDICSHDDSPLGDQELIQGAVRCPRHGARFDMATGAVLRSPAPVGIDSFPTRIDGDWVEADLEV